MVTANTETQCYIFHHPLRDIEINPVVSPSSPKNDRNPPKLRVMHAFSALYRHPKDARYYRGSNRDGKERIKKREREKKEREDG
ncbi:hypothetical protein VTH06DRAFT_8077 [Thermothelomyces fergusii]